MQITKELLEAQRDHAISERDNLLAKANAQIGAINAFNHLLAVLAEPEPQPVLPPATPKQGR